VEYDTTTRFLADAPVGEVTKNRRIGAGRGSPEDRTGALKTGQHEERSSTEERLKTETVSNHAADHSRGYRFESCRFLHFLMMMQH
jgi:hypothetical protein